MSTSTHGGPAGKERRADPRVQEKIQITWTGDNTFYTGFSNDISRGGIFIATSALIPMYHIVELEISLPQRPAPLKMVGEIRWIREEALEAIGPPGVGVKFLEISEEDLEEIEAFLGERAPILGNV